MKQKQWRKPSSLSSAASRSHVRLSSLLLKAISSTIVVLSLFQLILNTRHNPSSEGITIVSPATPHVGRHPSSSSLLSTNENSTTLIKNSVGQAHKTSTGEKKKPKKWAYCFLMAGCNPRNPSTYRNYMYNIIVAAHNLRKGSSSTDGESRADVLVMVRFSSSYAASVMGNNNHTTTTTTTTREFLELPVSDQEWLETFGIQIIYLPNAFGDNFYDAQMEKFRILQWTQYSRVMYMDADVMPLCNLDYMFALSSTSSETTNASSLQPNVILAWYAEPASGAFFVLEPGGYEEWQAIVHRREQEALRLPPPRHWDPVMGWGRKLTHEWKGIPNIQNPRHSLDWNFHGDFADQGLLYYWTRFHRNRVSIVFPEQVETWINDTLVETLSSSKNPLGRKSSCLPPEMDHISVASLSDYVPHRDFVHFSGSRKPWEQNRTLHDIPKRLEDCQGPADYWYYVFYHEILPEIMKLRGNLSSIPTFPLEFKGPPFGRYPTVKMMKKTIRKKRQQRNAGSA